MDTQTLVLNKVSGRKRYYKDAIVEILADVSMPCPPYHCGNIRMFLEAKAFLCYFENLPYLASDGLFSMISGFAIVDYPFGKLRDWVEGPLEYIDQEWDDKDLLHKSPEEAIANKINDLEKIWQSPLHTLCNVCKARGEECKQKLRSLNNS